MLGLQKVILLPPTLFLQLTHLQIWCLEFIMICKRCGLPKKIDDFQVVKENFRRNVCKDCHSQQRVQHNRRARYKRFIAPRLKEVPIRAIIRLLKENPHLVREVIRYHESTYLRYVEEEKQKVANEALKHFVKYGKLKSVEQRQKLIMDLCDNPEMDLRKRKAHVNGKHASIKTSS